MFFFLVHLPRIAFEVPHQKAHMLLSFAVVKYRVTFGGHEAELRPPEEHEKGTALLKARQTPEAGPDCWN